MKKLWIPAMCMLAMAGMSTSCTNDMEDLENSEDQQGQKGITIVAEMPAVKTTGNTRTELGVDEEGKLYPKWGKDDALIMPYSTPEGLSSRQIFVVKQGESPRQGIFESTIKEDSWLQSDRPVALYTQIEFSADHNITHFDKNKARPLYNPEEGKMTGFQSLTQKFQEEKDIHQCVQFVKRNQMDPYADWLISECVTEEMKESAKESLKLRFKRLNSLIKLKFVDKTTDHVLNGKDVSVVALQFIGDDALVCPFNIDVTNGKIDKLLKKDTHQPSTSIFYVADDIRRFEYEEAPIPLPGGPIYTFGTNDCVYISTLPVKFTGQIEILIILMNQGVPVLSVSKLVEITEPWELKAGTVHNLTVEYDDSCLPKS